MEGKRMKIGYVVIIMTLFVFATTQLLHARHHEGGHHEHGSQKNPIEHVAKSSGCKATDPRCSG